MFPSISQSATALGFHAPLPGLTPAAAAAAGTPAVTQSSSLSASVGVYNAAPSAASGLLTTVAPYGWPAALGLTPPTAGGLFADHQASSVLGPKVATADAINKRSPDLQQSSRAHHTLAGTASTHVTGSSAAAAAGRLQPYRANASDLLAGGTSALTGAQFAAFDSMYKAYQGAYAQGAGSAGLYGAQSMRLEDQLLTEQQLMLQASLLQYPHFGVFPGAAAAAAAAGSGLYPGLAASASAGIHFPQADFYAAQSLPPGLLMSMKMPNVSSSNWLGLDRLQTAPSSSVNDREVRDGRSEHTAVSSHGSLLKETDAKQRQLDRNVRDRPAEHVQRCHQLPDRDDGRRDGSRRPSESELQNRQERRHSGSHHHHHHHHQQHGSTTKDDTLRHNRHTGNHQLNSHSSLDGPSKHHSAVSRSDRLHSVHAVSSPAAEPLNLNRLTSLPASSSSSADTTPGIIRTPARPENSWEQAFFHQQQQQLIHDRDKSAKDLRRFSPGRNETSLPSSSDKLLPLTLTIPSRSGVPPVLATQPEQKFHRPFEVASRVDAASHRNKLAKQSHSSSTPDRPPPPLVHRSTSERNGTAVEVQRRQPQAAARLDVKYGTLSAAGTVDETPLNLVVGRHATSQHWSPAVNCTNASDLGHSVMQPYVMSDSWHRQRNKCDTSSSSRPVVSLLDRKSLTKAARQQSSVADGNSSDEEHTVSEDDVAEAKRRARLLLIVSGPPLKPDSSPSKMKFLQQFGLVTSSAGADVEFERRRKRRRILREPSMSPVTVDDAHDSDIGFTFPLHSSPLRDVAAVSPKELLLKATFLSLHGLQPCDPHLKQKLELSQRQSEADQLRLWNDLSTRILSLHSRRPYVAMSSAANNSADLHDPAAKQRSHHLTEGQLAGVNTVGLSSASRLHRSYSSQQSSPVDVYSTVSKAVLDLTGNDGSSIHKQRTNVVDVMSPPPSAFCLLGSESSSTPAYAPPPPFQAELPAGDGLMCANVHKSFHWPGIDAVMESYQLYLEEQALEKQLLVEQCQRVQQRNADLAVTADQLSSQLSELVHSRQQLSDDRARIQTAIDNLKCCFRLMQ